MKAMSIDRGLPIVVDRPGAKYTSISEEHGVMAEMLWAWVPFDDIASMHNELIERYPHRTPYYSEVE